MSTTVSLLAYAAWHCTAQRCTAHTELATHGIASRNVCSTNARRSQKQQDSKLFPRDSRNWIGKNSTWRDAFWHIDRPPSSDCSLHHLLPFSIHQRVNRSAECVPFPLVFATVGAYLFVGSLGQTQTMYGRSFSPFSSRCFRAPFPFFFFLFEVFVRSFLSSAHAQLGRNMHPRACPLSLGLSGSQLPTGKRPKQEVELEVGVRLQRLYSLPLQAGL
jgi:hypothetical protein